MIAMVPAGSEGMRAGWGTEAGFEGTGLDSGDTGLGFEDIGVELDCIGLRDMAPAVASTAEVVRPCSALVRLCIHLRERFGCCTRGSAAGYRLARLLLPWVYQPPRSSWADRLLEQLLRCLFFAI